MESWMRAKAVNDLGCGARIGGSVLSGKLLSLSQWKNADWLSAISWSVQARGTGRS